LTPDPPQDDEDAPSQSGRSLGVDLGTKRIGIAVSDAGGVLASPLTTIDRSSNAVSDHKRIAQLAAEEEAVRIVVGLPIALDGKSGIAANAAKEEIQRMSANIDLPIVTWDERMTSALAHKALKAQNVSEKKRRGQIDKIAAAIILQGWLDSRRIARTATV